MEKIRMTRVTVIEYPLISENYPDCDTTESMAALDASTDDYDLLFNSNDIISDKLHWQIIGGEYKPQRQDALNLQLKDLITVAEQHGMYDAADYIKQVLSIK